MAGRRGCMNTTYIKTMVVALSTMITAANADVIRLSDGTAYDGDLAEPATVLIRTASGEVEVPFAKLPPELQRRYWAPKQAQTMAGPVTNDELAALAASVNLKTWAQVASIGSFRDRPEKRGTGGLIITKAFNAIEENWPGIYVEGHALSNTRHWQDALERAKNIMARQPQFLQKRWLETFISAAEAVNKRDSAEFAKQVRELRRSTVASDAFAMSGY
jgi:hypothetical protein